jgi:hypothetical protein
MQDAYKQYKSDNLLGFQEKSAVFVKIPITAYGKTWKAGEEFNWITQPCRAEDWDKMRLTVASLYNQGKLHHDSAREVQNKIGDRLGELNTEKLISLVRQVNAIVKRRSTTEKEFQDKRLKQSKIPEKQRGIIRAWLNRNAWALEEFYPIRDHLLSNSAPKGEPVEDFVEDTEE